MRLVCRIMKNIKWRPCELLVICCFLYISLTSSKHGLIATGSVSWTLWFILYISNYGISKIPLYLDIMMIQKTGTQWKWEIMLLIFYICISVMNNEDLYIIKIFIYLTTLCATCKYWIELQFCGCMQKPDRYKSMILK